MGPLLSKPDNRRETGYRNTGIVHSCAITGDLLAARLPHFRFEQSRQFAVRRPGILAGRILLLLRRNQCFGETGLTSSMLQIGPPS